MWTLRKMPKYKYICNQCSDVVKEIRDSKDRKKEKNCKCGGFLQFQLPTIQEPSIMETVDKSRNIKHRKDQDKRIKKRAHDFFVENELDDLIAKHGEEQAKKFGWIKKDGKKKKKGDLS